MTRVDPADEPFPGMDQILARTFNTSVEHAQNVRLRNELRREREARWYWCSLGVIFGISLSFMVISIVLTFRT